jgi:hypothetical protein
MLTGEFEHYHGEAINPRHLSLWERCALWRLAFGLVGVWLSFLCAARLLSFVVSGVLAGGGLPQPQTPS